MTVTLSKWQKAPYIFVNDAPERVIGALDDELSFHVPDSRHTDAYKKGEWDGFEHLMRESQNGNYYFPLGCLERAVRVLDSLGVEYEVEGVSRPGRGDMDVSWHSDMTLRDYQQDAVNEALQRGHGSVVLPTGAGKTLIGLRLLYELRRPTVVFVHRQEIADQWVEDIENIIGVDVAQCYGGTKETGDVQVCLYQTLYDDDEKDVRDQLLANDHDVMLADEVHRVGADTFSRCAMALNSPYRFGFSATPEREDNATLKVIGGTGEFIADISAEQLISDGYLAEPQWKILTPPKNKSHYREWHDEYVGEIVENDARNEMVADTVADLPKPCYIHVERIAHGEILEEMIPGAKFICSDSNDRDEALETFRSGERDVLISTLLGEGVDVPKMESMVMAGGLKTSTGAIQKVGRALRPETENATVVDFVDNGRWVAEHSEQRIQTYRDYYGEYGP